MYELSKLNTFKHRQAIKSSLIRYKGFIRTRVLETTLTIPLTFFPWFKNGWLVERMYLTLFPWFKKGWLVERMY